jgi:hypothetical protein
MPDPPPEAKTVPSKRMGARRGSALAPACRPGDAGYRAGLKKRDSLEREPYTNGCCIQPMSDIISDPPSGAKAVGSKFVGKPGHAWKI